MAGIIILGLMVFLGVRVRNQKKIDPCLSVRTNALGNRLSEYFYFTNTARASDRKLKREKSCNAKTLDHELNNFYSKLNWVRQDTLIDYKSNPEAEWSQLDDASAKPNFLAYWQTIRPQARSLYERNIRDPGSIYPVIHFRCSDIPFVRHYHYHLIKASSARWMTEKIKERGFDKVVFLNCHRHNNLDVHGSCAKYVNFYLNLFRASGIEVETQCNTIFKDFALMVYSPLLVSLSPSSFAFMAGISKDPQDYMSCNMGIEINGQYFEQTSADWILAPAAPLLHKDIEDYHNAEEVVDKLSK